MEVPFCIIASTAREKAILILSDQRVQWVPAYVFGMSNCRNPLLSRRHIRMRAKLVEVYVGMSVNGFTYGAVCCASDYNTGPFVSCPYHRNGS